MKVRKLVLPVFFLIQVSVSFSQDYTITDFGAREGKLSTQAIQKAVDECYASDKLILAAGIVIIPDVQKNGSPSR